MATFIHTEETKKTYSTWGLLKTLTISLKPYRTRFIIASILRLIGDIVWLYPAYALAQIVTFLTTYTKGQPLQPLFLITLLWALATLIRFICMYYAKFWGFQIGEQIDLDSQLKTIRHLFLLDIGWHEKENAGNKMKKIDRGSDGLNKIVRMWIGNFIEIGVNLVGAIFIIATFDSQIAIITAIFLLVYFFVSRFYIKRASRASQIVNVAEENMEGLLYESVNNIRSVKVMSMMTPLHKFLTEKASDLLGKVKTRIFWFQSATLVKSILGQGFRIAMVALICFGILNGHYEVGFLVLFYGYFSNLWTSVSELADTAQDFTIAKYGVGRMTDILNVPIEIDKEEGKVPFPKDWKKITISDLSFSYGSKKVLDSVSFEINRGEKIGIIGLSGAGKSTVFKLLLKEHESYSGNIFLDDIPLKNISKKSYFDHIAVVLQETEVFNFSLRDNVTISNHNHEHDQPLLEKALNVAHVSEFAATLPKNVDTEIGEKGIRLSGGEKQRVGIARAVFKDPQILLLDEATSHLDVESEDKIQDSLHQFFKTVTAVVIAHRLTTIKEMDRILVLENGRIIESGSFDDLYNKKGRFHELWEKQKL